MKIVEIFILLNTMHKLNHLYIYTYTYLNKYIYTYTLFISYIIYACTTLLNTTKDKEIIYSPCFESKCLQQGMVLR